MKKYRVILFPVAALLLVALVGLLAFTRKKGIELVHPERTSPASTPADYGILAAAGYGGLLFDLRNHGESGGDVTTFGVAEIQDVQGAVNFLLARPEVDPDKIAILGHSMGAAIALMAAADIPEIRAVVAESAFTSLADNVDYGVETLTGLPAFPFADLIAFFAQREAGFSLEAVDPISRLDAISPRPILFIQGTEDEKVRPESAQELYNAASDPKSLFYVEGAMHRIGLVDTEKAAFQGTLITFLDQHLNLSGTAQNTSLSWPEMTINAIP